VTRPLAFVASCDQGHLAETQPWRAGHRNRAPGLTEPSRVGVLPAYGVFARHVKDLELANIHVSYAKPDLRSALMCVDVKGLDVDNFKGRGPRRQFRVRRRPNEPWHWQGNRLVLRREGEAPAEPRFSSGVRLALPRCHHVELPSLALVANVIRRLAADF
jgi:hypothetical protein